MDKYSAGVALFDFVPVLVAGTALALLARGIASRNPALGLTAWIGAALVVTGGLCKASWKLLVALYEVDIAWLQTLLFIAMAPGFVALAFSVDQTRRAWAASGPSAQALLSPALIRLAAMLGLPLLIAVLLVVAVPESRAWFFWLLGVTTLANAAMVVAAARLSRLAGLKWPIAACFAANFLGTLVLSGLSRLPPTEENAWLQESVNLVTQLALLIACSFLSHRLLHPVDRNIK